MDSQLIPHSEDRPSPLVRGDRASRRLANGLARIQGDLVLREAATQAEAQVTVDKIRELDFVAYEGMSGQAMLHRWGALLAGDDILLADDVNFFKGMTKIGKGEIIADLVNKFRKI
jgi:hypothetical protein